MRTRAGPSPPGAAAPPPRRGDPGGCGAARGAWRASGLSGAACNARSRTARASASRPSARYRSAWFTRAGTNLGSIASAVRRAASASAGRPRRAYRLARLTCDSGRSALSAPRRYSSSARRGPPAARRSARRRAVEDARRLDAHRPDLVAKAGAPIRARSRGGTLSSAAAAAPAPAGRRRAPPRASAGSESGPGTAAAASARCRGRSRAGARPRRARSALPAPGRAVPSRRRAPSRSAAAPPVGPYQRFTARRPTRPGDPCGSRCRRPVSRAPRPGPAAGRGTNDRGAGRPPCRSARMWQATQEAPAARRVEVVLARREPSGAWHWRRRGRRAARSVERCAGRGSPSR